MCFFRSKILLPSFQGLLIADLNVLGIVANDNDTVTLPPALDSDTCIVVNKGANQAQIFPNTNDNLGEGQNIAISIPKSSIIVFYRSDTTNWVHLHVPRDGSMAPSAFGDMYENNETGTPMNFREFAVFPDGQRTYLSRKFPVPNIEGSPNAVGGISIDITEIE